jgi:ABC-type transporter Mla subunit MlaD
MREQMEQRLQELRSEFESGQKLLAELDAKQTHLRSSLLRISGAMQVLEELLSQEASVHQPSDTVEPQNTSLAAVG